MKEEEERGGKTGASRGKLPQVPPTNSTGGRWKVGKGRGPRGLAEGAGHRLTVPYAKGRAHQAQNGREGGGGGGGGKQHAPPTMQRSRRRPGPRRRTSTWYSKHPRRTPRGRPAERRRGPPGPLGGAGRATGLCMQPARRTQDGTTVEPPPALHLTQTCAHKHAWTLMNARSLASRSRGRGRRGWRPQPCRVQRPVEGLGIMVCWHRNNGSAAEGPTLARTPTHDVAGQGAIRHAAACPRVPTHGAAGGWGGRHGLQRPPLWVG
jgi:hypothetical protein